MKFLVFKVVDTESVDELSGFMGMGWEVQPMVEGVVQAGGSVVKRSPGARITRRKRRRRAPQRATPELIRKVQQLRKQGLCYRIIGQRLGFGPARAWQLANLNGHRSRKDFAAATKQPVSA